MRLTPNFDLQEFQAASDRTLTETEVAYAGDLAFLLEVARAALGNQQLVITSYVRTGDPRQHGEGTAVDFRPPRSMSQRDIFDALNAVATGGGFGTFGQLIFYPFSDQHVHLSLPTGTKRNEILIADASETEYSSPTAALIASIPGGTVTVLLLALVAIWALGLFRGSGRA